MLYLTFLFLFYRSANSRDHVDDEIDKAAHRLPVSKVIQESPVSCLHTLVHCAIELNGEKLCVTQLNISLQG